MNVRDTFREVLTGKSTKSIKIEYGYWAGTIKRWAKEGLPIVKPLPSSIQDGDSIMSGEELFPSSRYFDQNVGPYFGLEKFMAKLSIDMSPMFDVKILKETNEYKVLIDSYGIKQKIRINNASMPLFMDHPIKTRNDFEEYKQYYDDNIEKRLPKNWDKVVKRVKNRNFLIRLGGNPYGFFGFLRYLMGFKNLLIKMYDEPKLIKDINEFFLNYVIKAWSKILEDVEVDCAYIWEDMAYKSGSMISPDMFREFLSPYYKRMVSFLKENGVDIILVDSDGYIEELVPLMKEVGVTGLWPWEIQAGNNLLRVRKNYPDLQIIGGVDKSILRKDKNTIDKELEKISFLLKKGRFIPHMDHLIPPDSKWENFKYYRKKLNEMIDEN